MTQPGPLETEPVAVFLTGLAAIVNLGVILAAAFDWVYLTDNQAAAIVAFITGVIAVVGAMLRSTVWAPASVDKLAGGPY